MRYFLLLVFIIFSCQSKEPSYQDKIYDTISTFITYNINDSNKSANEKVMIDTIEVLNIDTLTEKGILRMKADMVLEESQKSKEKRDLKIEKYKLEASIGLYSKAELNKKIKDLLDEAKADLEQFEKINSAVNSSVDSVTLRYYKVMAKVKITGPDMSQKDFEVPLIVTKDFRVKEFSEL